MVRRPGGGLSLWCELPEPRSSDLLAHAEVRDILLAPGPSFAPEGGLDRFLRLPYAAPAHVLTDAVPRIAEAWARTLAEEPGLRSDRRPRDKGPTLVA
jgi:DNA-binding transcriptional MocR family regulator